MSSMIPERRIDTLRIQATILRDALSKEKSRCTDIERCGRLNKLSKILDHVTNVLSDELSKGEKR